MTWFPPEDAARAAVRAEELEKDYEGSVLASRPTGRPLEELVTVHESRQRRIHTFATAAHVLSMMAVVTAAVSAHGEAAILVAALLFASGLGMSLWATLRSRRFERRVRTFGNNPVPRKAAA